MPGTCSCSVALIKMIGLDGQGACLFAKRLEHGRFLWPSPADGVVAISPRSRAASSRASIGGRRKDQGPVSVG